MKLGIIGAGWIAGRMAETLRYRPEGCACYAIASRDIDKARLFAAKWDIPVAYGSYEELVADPEVDLVYVATPHSHHYRHAHLAIEHGKPCLIEKAFTANAREAEELIRLAESKGVFVTEAIWTRYMPLSHKVTEIIQSGMIGRPSLLTASLCYHMEGKERIMKPELCGGALLDLGVYVLNFARMYFGDQIRETVSSCQLSDTGVDMQESIALTFADGKMADLQASALCVSDRHGIIRGTEGYLWVDNINCPTEIRVYRQDQVVDSYYCSQSMITGYEYQVFECKRCLAEGLIESPMMPHHETIAIMQQMDALRKDWGVQYPADSVSSK